MQVAHYNGHQITKQDDGNFRIDSLAPGAGVAPAAWDPQYNPVSVLQNLYDAAGGTNSGAWPQNLRNGWDVLAPALGIPASGGVLNRPVDAVFTSNEQVSDFDINSLPLVGPIVGSISEATGFSPMIVLIAATGLALWLDPLSLFGKKR